MMTLLRSRQTAVLFAPSLSIRLAAALFLTVLLAFPTSAQQWPREQTSDLMALRCSTSPAERKLSFNLLLISRSARHASVGGYADRMDSSSVNPDGTVNVEITAYLSPSLMASRVMASVIRANGAIPLPAYISDRLQVRVTKAQLLDLAANPNVLAIRDGSASPAPGNMAANDLPAVVGSR